MKKQNLLGVFLILGVFLNSCMSDPSLYEEPKDIPKSDFFDFSTITTPTLNLDYNLVDYSIRFEVYDQNPFVDDTNQELKVGIKPLFFSYTDKDGKFSGSIRVLSKLDKVYICSEYLGVPHLVEAQVTKDGIFFNIKGTSKTRTQPRAIEAGDAKVLGSWNADGVPDYLLADRAKVSGDFFYTINQLLKWSKTDGILVRHPEFLGDDRSSELRIIKTSPVRLSFVSENASIKNKVGYYCYKTSDGAPKTTADVQKVLAFPNASFAFSGGDLSCGEQIQLKYWDGAQWQNEFPAGTTIGWYVQYSTDTFYSTSALNKEPKEYRKHDIGFYDEGNVEFDGITFSMEDRERKDVDDGSFNDVIFYALANKGCIDKSGLESIIAEPEPEPKPEEEENALIYSGTLIFEDCWPQMGDYDMNDVVIEYTSKIYRSGWQLVNIDKTVDTFVPRNNGAAQFMKNGFAYQLSYSKNVIASINRVPDYVESTPFKLGKEGYELGANNYNTIPVFSNMWKTELNKPIVITVRMMANTNFKDLRLPPYNPFIVINERRGREVHLPFSYRPTELKDLSLFNTENDCTDFAIGCYYVAKDNYPFAMHLAGSFKCPKEQRKIQNAYPQFSKWVSSKGEEAKEWYKEWKAEEVVDN